MAALFVVHLLVVASPGPAFLAVSRTAISSSRAAGIIAGFPTETEEMFARSQDLVEECSLTFLHVFPYSKRPGTPAARMPHVVGAVIRERAKRLRATGEAALRRRLNAEIGADRDVLIAVRETARKAGPGLAATSRWTAAKAARIETPCDRLISVIAPCLRSLPRRARSRPRPSARLR